jgi:4'-phosphopantetheinyl transferase
MRSPQLQQRFIAAHGGLRELLGRYLRVHPGEVRFGHNEFGKPALSGQFGGRLTFNLSHSADLALIGVATDAKIGVDVEHIRDEPDFTEIAQWFFAAAEVEELNRLPSELRARAFLSSWTRKEACAKAQGKGLGATNEIAEPPGWSLYSLQPAPGYVGALVVEGSGWRVTQRFASLDAQ